MSSTDTLSSYASYASHEAMAGTDRALRIASLLTYGSLAAKRMPVVVPMRLPSYGSAMQCPVQT
eukprot:1559028-Rhodomonas_salina.2